MITLSGRELMPVVRAALERGQSVRLTANGSSMLPFIHDGETIEVVPPTTFLKLGDIVLAQTAGDRYVIHRIIKIEDESLYLRGDAQQHREGPLPRQAVLGRAVTTNRNGRVRVLDHGVWRWAGMAWMRSGWTGYYLLQLALRLRRLGRGMLSRDLRTAHDKGGETEDVRR